MKKRHFQSDSLPIGTEIRKNNNKKTRIEVKENNTSVSEIDDQIKLLERELENMSDSESDSESENSSEENDEDEEEGEGESEGDDNEHSKNSLVEVVDDNGNVISLRSQLNEEKIEPLPKSLLPTMSSSGGSSKKKQQPKQQQQQQQHTARQSQAPSGLEKSIIEMLRHYKPTSSEKKPLWCRICSFQASTETEFLEHRQSELHRLTSQQERKMSTCKICRKEFTSPEQLKEHLKGKAHHERLQTLQTKQHQQGSRSRYS